MEPLSRTGEFGLIRWIREQFGATGAGPVQVGIGDDAAVLRQPGSDLLASTDAMVQNVHFDCTFETPYQIGYRGVVANVSDIHAMNGIPLALLVTLGAPPETDRVFVEELYRGMGDAARRYGTAIVGGDTVSSPLGIFLSFSVLGETDAPVLRSGASLGDLIFLAGCVGQSALGLAVLRKIGKPVAIEAGELPDLEDLPGESLARMVRSHALPDLPPVPRGATSMIDVSDGLLADAMHLAEESGLGMRLDASRIPLDDDMTQVAAKLGVDLWDLVCAGGEDYALLFTLPPQHPPPPGAVEIGSMTDSETLFIDEHGRERAFGVEGWDHFRSQQGRT